MMPAATDLLLIRHAHTSSNGGSTAVLSGRTDLPLSARGWHEVTLLARRVRDTHVDAIYSSPLRRARDTASAFELDAALRVQLCPELQEIDCGFLDGLPLTEVKRRFPRYWTANLRQNDDRFRWPGGESYREFRARSLSAIRRLAQAHGGRTIAIVTHAGVISQIIGALERLSPAAWEQFRPGNTGISRLTWRCGSASVLAFDDRTHLSPLQLTA
jgi:alpha-ribazole phosphatase/probable phosphoglycerate mutase